MQGDTFVVVRPRRYRGLFFLLFPLDKIPDRPTRATYKIVQEV